MRPKPKLLNLNPKIVAPKANPSPISAEKEAEWREEAQRLKQCTREDQRQVIAIHRRIAADPSVPESDRADAAARADALERLLGFPRLVR